MQATRTTCGFLFALTLGAAPVSAQFKSGSNGSYGPIDVPTGTTVTLDVPVNGIFNATTVTVNGTLSFRNNVLNTPVYLLATGDIAVNASGTISVDGGSGTSNSGGPGGPGGFDGGAPGIQEAAPGAGMGPGGGKGGAVPYPNDGFPGNGAYGGVPTLVPSNPNHGTVYGSPLLVPLVGGSGGGGSGGSAGVYGGGGGGGAILLSSDTRVVVNGTVNASGGLNSSFLWGHGSGGAIRVVAHTVAGTGSLQATTYANYGGMGRIRVDLIDRSQFNLNLSYGVASVGSFMTVFPTVVPHLDVVSVAGNAIPEGSTGPVVFVLPFNSPTTQPVTVQGRDFTGVVPIRIVLTPDSGAPTSIDAQIDMGAGNPATVTVNATFPQNVAVRVHAWTR